MEEKSGTGYKRVLFQGYSMYPFLKPCDVLVLTAVETRSVGLGDIVCIARGRRYITHRVVDIRYRGPVQILVTKGDNLPRVDRPLSLSSGSLLKVTLIIRNKGRLVRPRFGKTLAFLSRKNLSPGITKGRIGRIMRGLRGRFRILFNKEPSRP